MTYTFEKAYRKLASFCAYQERSHDEVWRKLAGFSLTSEERSACLALLIEQNYLNEERFAKAYTGGKFRLKGWGRVRIAHELKARRVSAGNIRIALADIDENDYRNRLAIMAAKKWQSIKGNAAERRAKLSTYLIGRGFESTIVMELLRSEAFRAVTER